MKDYDAIGIDVDHCIVKYNVVDYIRHSFKSTLSVLFNNYQYPREVLVQDWDTTKFIFLNNSVWDIDKGTILKLAEGGVITHAVLGLTVLTKLEI